jgi:hypothetical protein
MLQNQLSNYLLQVVTRKEILTGIQLQYRTLAEAFYKDVKTFYQSPDPAPIIEFKTDFFRSHKRFLDRKCFIY